MKLGKSTIIAIIVLVAIVSIITGFYLNEIFKVEKIEVGDCVEINYIGRYANNTVFDTSYADVANQSGIYDEYRTYEPLKVYVNPESETTPPKGYEKYTTVIEGLRDALIGMKEGEEKLIGPIPPEKAYGMPLEVNSTFNSTMLSQMMWTLEFVQKLRVMNMTDENITLRWEAEIGYNMTFYPFWENASEVIKVNETEVWIKTTPEANSTFEISGMEFKVENVTEEKINISYMESGNKYYLPDINRTIPIPRIYPLPKYVLPYLESDLEAAGLSSNEMAGKTLYFKVEIVKIYKVS
jgi:FKBP-type peptidyl-prolyl cis-trans isomerase 2